MAFRWLSVCATIGVSAILVGCGSGSKSPVTVPVKGVVTYQGKPVPKLSIAFTPEEKGLLAIGTTDSNGRFTLMTNKAGDGAMVGTYKVSISFVSDKIPEMPGLPGTEEKPPVSPIPLKYADAATSGLTKSVEKDAAKNNFTFDLVD